MQALDSSAQTATSIAHLGGIIVPNTDADAVAKSIWPGVVESPAIIKTLSRTRAAGQISFR